MKIIKLVYFATILIILQSCSSSKESPVEAQNPCGNVSSFTVVQNKGSLDFNITTDKPGPYEISYINLQFSTEPEYGTKFITGNKIFSKVIGQNFILNPTAYSFFIRNICSSSSKSDWGLEKTITINNNYCVVPVNLQITNFTNNTISWDVNSSFGNNTPNFQVQYGPQGFTPINFGIPPTGVVSANVAGTQFNATMLLNNTYDIYVRSFCSSAEVSNWIGPKTYTCTSSTNQCAAPTYASYTVAAQTSTSFSPNITWENDGVSQYEVGLTFNTTAPPTQGQLTVVNGSNSATYTNLLKNNNYYFFVRKICPGNTRSPFYGPYLVKVL